MKLPVFRFDDISINTDLERLGALMHVIREHIDDVTILLAISPIVFSQNQLGDAQTQRVHPSRLTAMSELYPYYKGQRCGLPILPRATDIVRAGHGLLHVDHRLLDRQAQEMSIVTSCALADATVFVPPYNHWNVVTDLVCKKHYLELVRFEDGWQHALHSRYQSMGYMWYCHPYDFTPSQLKKWFES